MFNWKKTQLHKCLGVGNRHDGHTELFKRIQAEHGQVCIMVRDVQGADAGMGNTDNPGTSMMLGRPFVMHLNKALHIRKRIYHNESA